MSFQRKLHFNGPYLVALTTCTSNALFLFYPVTVNSKAESRSKLATQPQVAFTHFETFHFSQLLLRTHKATSFPMSIQEGEFNELCQRSVTLVEQNTKECASVHDTNLTALEFHKYQVLIISSPSLQSHFHHC